MLICFGNVLNFFCWNFLAQRGSAKNLLALLPFRKFCFDAN